MNNTTTRGGLTLNIGQYNTLEIFTVKGNAIPEIRKELQNYIFAELDRSSSVKNFSDRSEVKPW